MGGRPEPTGAQVSYIERGQTPRPARAGRQRAAGDVVPGLARRHPVRRRGADPPAGRTGHRRRAAGGPDRGAGQQPGAAGAPDRARSCSGRPSRCGSRTSRGPRPRPSPSLSTVDRGRALQRADGGRRRRAHRHHAHQRQRRGDRAGGHARAREPAVRRHPHQPDRPPHAHAARSSARRRSSASATSADPHPQARSGRLPRGAGRWWHRRMLGDAARDLLLGTHCVGCAEPGRLLCDDCADAAAHRGRRWPGPRPTPAGLVAPFATAAYDGTVKAMVLGHKERRLLALAPAPGAAARPRGRPAPGAGTRWCWCRCRRAGPASAPAATTRRTR